MKMKYTIGRHEENRWSKKVHQRIHKNYYLTSNLIVRFERFYNVGYFLTTFLFFYKMKYFLLIYSFPLTTANQKT